MSQTHAAPTPLVLLVEDQEWTSRSIESVLRPKGFGVLKAYTGRQALDLVSKISPDLVIVDFHLPDLDGIDVVEALRQAPTLSPVTPIFMMSTSTVTKAERLEAYGAGVWDILRHPVDPAELVLRMETFVGAKQETDRIRHEGLTDPSTGFYNVRGLLQRAEEVSADAVRFQRPLACIAFGPETLGEIAGEISEVADQLADAFAKELAGALGKVTRLSDSVGSLGPGEFVIVAPGTTREGALRLADRVLHAVRGSRPEDGTVEPGLRAGFYAYPGSEDVSPQDLLLRATTALRRAQADDGSFQVRSYDA